MPKLIKDNLIHIIIGLLVVGGGYQKLQALETKVKKHDEIINENFRERLASIETETIHIGERTKRIEGKLDSFLGK